MFYEPDKRDHGLPLNPFKALVVPRPIGWISTVSPEGDLNLAPFSFFNMFGSDPPCVVFGTSSRVEGTRKDTHDNVERGGDFVVNVVSQDHLEAMVATSYPYAPGESEFERAGLTALPSKLVKSPRVEGVPASFECVYVQSVDLPSNDQEQKPALVIGRVVGVHVADEIIVDGKIDVMRLRPLGRLGYMDYATVDNIVSKPSLAGRPLKL